MTVILVILFLGAIALWLWAEVKARREARFIAPAPDPPPPLPQRVAEAVQDVSVDIREVVAIVEEVEERAYDVQQDYRRRKVEEVARQRQNHFTEAMEKALERPRRCTHRVTDLGNGEYQIIRTWGCGHSDEEILAEGLIRYDLAPEWDDAARCVHCNKSGVHTHAFPGRP